ncbi:MAG: hypothetical protein PUI86_06005 [Bacteroidales bacterium]|nr:hypothetical protein [Bacteroidales bacterium]
MKKNPHYAKVFLHGIYFRRSSEPSQHAAVGTFVHGGETFVHAVGSFSHGIYFWQGGGQKKVDAT